MVSKQKETGSILVNETFYLDGKGVVGQQFTISAECVATPGTVEQPATTTISEANTNGIRYQAKSALIAAGPRRQRSPAIEQWSKNKLIKSTAVLKDQPDANKMVDMLVANDRALLLAQLGRGSFGACQDRIVCSTAKPKLQANPLTTISLHYQRADTR